MKKNLINIRGQLLICLLQMSLFLLVFLFASISYAQNGEVRGRVLDRDSTSFPLSGVSVIVKGSTMGTVTNDDGEFYLSNISETAVLVFSMSSYNTIDLKVSELKKKPYSFVTKIYC